MSNRLSSDAKPRSQVFRVVLLLLVISFCCAVLAACDTSSSNAQTGPTEGEKLSSFHYDQPAFTVYVGSYGWVTDDIWCEENDEDAEQALGKPVYEAVLKRMQVMQEQYHVTLALTGAQDKSPYTEITQQINAGQTSFQAIMTQGSTCYTLALEGYLQDYHTQNGIDLKSDVWDQNFVKQLNINDRLYFLLGDISLLDDRSTHAIAFDKSLLDSLAGLPDTETLYELVQNGAWTLDRMIEYVQIAAADLDGDGAITSQDRVGLVYRQTSGTGFLQGCGVPIAENDGNGNVTLSFMREKTPVVWDKLLTLIDPAYSINDDMEGVSVSTLMREDRCLFLAEYVDSLYELRRHEIDFGVLPMPKYDEAQPQYISPSHDYGTNFLCVPATNADVSDTLTVLTLLAEQGNELLTPAFYENLFGDQFETSQNEIAVLDLIFDTKYYDLGTYMNWANFSVKLMQAWNRRSSDIVGLYETYANRIQRQIDKIDSYDTFAPS